MGTSEPEKELIDSVHGPEHFQSQILADRLAFLSLALFVIYAATAVTSLVPLQLLDPIWQLKSIAILLESAALPLLALGLLHLSSYLDPQNLPLKRRCKTVARWAILAAIGFLLICPLQIYAALSTYSNANITVERQEARATETANAVREAINESKSHEDLQRRLRDLQRPDLRLTANTTDLQSIPLPLLKTQLLARLKEAEDQAKKSFKRPDPDAVQGLVRDSLKIFIVSAVLALAFAAGAQRKGSEVPLLVELHTMWALRSMGRSGRGNQKRIAGIPVPLSNEIAEESYFEKLVPEEDEPAPRSDN